MNKDIMKQCIFKTELDRVSNNKCPFCDLEIKSDSFKDLISKKEYKISGMCQKCQDEIFER